MNDFRGYATAPADVKEQIAAVCEVWQRHLPADIIGIYLHGSLALECFMPGVSDVDLLIVLRRRMERAERLAIAGEILALDQSPSPLEMSALWDRQLTPWQFPTLCQFHYSDFWTARYRQCLADAKESCFLLDTDFADPDIACHVRLTRQSGICLVGAPIETVFPEVPEADFWHSISDDVEKTDFHAGNERYFPSNILILGRVLSYRREKRILSKYEGGEWMLKNLPARFHKIIRAALDAWYGKQPLEIADTDLLEALRQELIRAIRAEEDGLKRDDT